VTRRYNPDYQVTESSVDVRAALDRLLASKAFATSGRAGRLLTFLVERTLAGDGDTLKEYVVGVEVFQRPEGFDPRLDSIVRVEVRRLRARLDAYYRDEGATDPVVISIPRGTYQPAFTTRPVDEPGPPAGAGRVERRLQRVSLAGLVVLILAVVAWLVVARPGSGADAVSIAVLPFSAYGAGERAGELAARITDGVTTALAASTAMSVVSRTTAGQFSDRMAIPAVARAVGADLVMEGGVVIDSAGIRVTARLVDGRTDRKVWVGQYEVAPDGIDALVRRIATEAAAASR